MDAYGLEPERFALVWCSAAEADRFVAAVTEMDQVVRRLGPNPLVDAREPAQEEVA